MPATLPRHPTLAALAADHRDTARISRFEEGNIDEDWAPSDTLARARQLGLWRSLPPLLKHACLLRERARAETSSS